MTYWHGGKRIAGDRVLPSATTGVSRSGDHGVFVTTDRSLAEAYASTVDGQAWVYEVRPDDEPEPVPSLVGNPGVSFRCASAHIIRRFTVPAGRRAAYRAAILPMLMSGGHK
jgi:hypothetical protein